MKAQDTITIKARRLKTTAAAVLIEAANGIRAWLPKSQIIWSPGSVDYVVPRWLALKKGLA